MVQRQARQSDLTSHAGQLQNAAAALGAEVREGRFNQLDRASHVGSELMVDLIVGQFLHRPGQPIARIADDHVDVLKLDKSEVHP